MVAGSTRARSQADDFVVTRYNADGTLDSTFGTGGVVVTDLRGTGGHDHARGIAIDAQGRIVVAGDSDQDFAAVRYLSDGSLDTSFGGTESAPRLAAPRTWSWTAKGGLWSPDTRIRERRPN